MGWTHAAMAAQQEYFVEVGEDVAESSVEAAWQELQSKHKAQLGKLKLYPKDVFQGGKKVASRMQAGPIEQKTAALKICTRLFKADVPCFVIEGVNDVPPMAMMDMNGSGAVTKNDGKLPWTSSRAEVAAAPEVKEDESFFALPWLSEDKPKTEVAERKRPSENVDVSEEVAAKKAEKAEKEKLAEKEKAAKAEKLARDEASKREASVKVAEAIRVPLSDESTLPPSGGISVSALPDLKPAYGVPRAANGEDEAGSEKSGAGWLAVDSFLNEEVAISLWDEVRADNKKTLKGLQAKVDKPATGDAKATLRVGPFASSAEAYKFCQEGLQARDRGLNCSFAPNDAGFANKTMGQVNMARGDAYEARRTGVERRRPTQNPLGELAPAAGTQPNQYWVQVASAGSQMEAMKKWEGVKSAHGEVIGGLRSSVSPSATDKSVYVVRVGPIVNNDDAIRVCSQLQKRQVECRVLLYSAGGNS